MGILSRDKPEALPELEPDLERSVIEALRRYAAALNQRHNLRIDSVRFQWDYIREDGRETGHTLGKVSISVESP